MTRLGIITQFLSKMSNQPENELLAWAQENVDPAVLLKLNEEVTSDEVSVLVNELEKSPEAFLSALLRQITWEKSQKRSEKVCSTASRCKLF